MNDLKLNFSAYSAISDLPETSILSSSTMSSSTPSIIKFNAAWSPSVSSLSTLTKSPFDLDEVAVKCNYNAEEEHSAIWKNGLRIASKLHDGLQGELYSAFRARHKRHSDSGSHEDEESVVIKRVSIACHQQSVAELDDMMWYVPKDIVKEGLVLHYLTVQNRCIGDYVVHKRSFFSSAHHYYLVTKHTKGMSLALFVEKAHQYLRMGLMKHKGYIKIIKFIFWQLFVFLRWLHDDMSVCHFDLKPKHIILQDAEFVVDPCTGQVQASHTASVKVVDFGSAELFRNHKFACTKEYSPLAEARYQCPRSFAEDKYDARLHDMWAVGLMLAECLLGRPLFDTRKDEGYVAVEHGILDEYLELFGLCKYVNSKAMDCLKTILDPSEATRFRAADALEHKWFRSYYTKYKDSIERKSQSQKRKLENQSEWTRQMPCYLPIPRV